MSICIISDHIIMLRQNFIVIPQHIDQVKPKYEGGGLQPPKPPPPLGSAVTVIYVSPGNVFPAHISLGIRVSPHTYH